jgi:hypothetical protein
MQSKGSNNGEKIDFKTLFWKPKIGSQVVRIVPRKSNPDYPFAEVSFHQYNVFKKSIYCLENFGEKDPVVQLVKELYNENTAESKELAKKIGPRYKFFAQVVVRGEENLGTRIWEFNKTTYEKLLTIMANEDYGEIDNIVSGTDLTVEGYKDSVKIGKKEVEYIAVNITPKRNSTPLAKTEAEVKAFLENQKDILEIYKRYSYEDIKQMLKNYISPSDATAQKSDDEVEESSEEVTVSAPETQEEDDTPPFTPDPPKGSSNKKGTHKNASDKFNEVFEDED